MNYTLKRDGWHFKLQKWIFGEDMPRFDNFCPFFWLTIFCVMVSPFVGTFRLLARAVGLLLVPFEYVSRPIEWLFNRVVSERKVRYERSIVTFVDEVTDWQAYQLFRTMYGWSSWYDRDSALSSLYTTSTYDKWRDSKRTYFRDRFRAWQKQNEDWQQRIFDCRKQEVKAIEEEKERKRKRRSGFANIAERTKLLVWLPIGLFVTYLVYWIALLVLVISENPGTFFNVLAIGGIVLAIVAALVGIGMLVVKSGVLQTNVARPFKFIGRVTFVPIGRGIKEVCSFLWMNVVAFKENYCPQIDWTD